MALALAACIIHIHYCKTWCFFTLFISLYRHIFMGNVPYPLGSRQVGYTPYLNMKWLRNHLNPYRYPEFQPDYRYCIE